MVNVPQYMLCHGFQKDVYAIAGEGGSCEMRHIVRLAVMLDFRNGYFPRGKVALIPNDYDMALTGRSIGEKGAPVVYTIERCTV
jgi:hypothetical protein